MRARALAVLVALAPLATRAGDPVYATQTPPPETFSALRWGSAPGYWYSEAQVIRIQGRIAYLENKAAKECVDQQIAQAGRWPVWVGTIAGVVIGGTVTYFALRKR